MIDRLKVIDTPLGKGTVLGLNPDRDAVCVMLTRPKEQRDKKHGATYIRWFAWDGEKITGDIK